MYYPGDMVAVRSVSEILSTLDSKGACGNLPFMPEMQKFIGKELRVVQRVDKVCNLVGPMSKISGAVTLEDARCDGGSHDGCQMRCAFIWREEWLSDAREHDSENEFGAIPLGPPLPTRTDRGTYYCQATELRRAARGDVQWWYVGQYLGDLRSRTFRTGELLSMLWRGFLRKVFRRVNALMASGLQRGAPFQEHLGLEPGDKVEVRGREQILKTLDRLGKHRGLRFSSDMLQYCGMQLRVSARVDRVISEATGRMVPLKNTVMLEDCVCDRYRGCGRRMFHLWREVWLKRM